MSSYSEAHRSYYERNRERIKQKRREHYLANREKSIAAAKAYYADHREDVLEKQDDRRRNMPAEQHLWAAARQRAREKSIPFSITPDDLEIPEVCPVLGIPLVVRFGAGTKGGPVANSASVDRVVPELGYVPGNVKVISFRANRIKCDASPEELRRVLGYVDVPAK